MKIVRFKTDGGDIKYGVLNDSTINELNGNIFEKIEPLDNTYATGDVTILPPTSPTKIVAIGLNYKDHALEMGTELPEEPRMFLKPSTTVIGHKDRIILPNHMSKRVDYEGELAVIIGRQSRHVAIGDAGDYILGYTCLNDVTARDLQAKDIQFTRAKGFDTFAPVGPVIETEVDPGSLEISTYLNGERKQHSNTSELIFNVYELLSFVSAVMTLYPGDIISTGTPAGVSPMKSGDIVEVEIEGIGRLRNTVSD